MLHKIERFFAKPLKYPINQNGKRFKKMRNRIAPLHHKIFTHPFNVGLYNGTLPRDIFVDFLKQDRLYLIDFSTALKQVADRLTDVHQKTLFFNLSNNILKTEMNLHNKYLLQHERQHFFFQSEKIPISKNLVVSEYTKYLLSTAENASVSAAVASLIPCFYIYSTLLGLPMLPIIKENHPYHSWLKSYTSEHFLLSTQSIINIIEEFKTEPNEVEEENMVAAFVKATEFEIEFWNSIYNQAPEIQNLSTTQKPLILS